MANEGMWADIADGLADMHEAAGRTDMARICRETAFEERAYAQEVAAEDAVTELTESISEVIDQVGPAAKNAKHTQDCWKRHAHCLANKIGALL